jgi:hypothetical protein
MYRSFLCVFNWRFCQTGRTFSKIGRTFSKIGRTFLMYLPEDNFGTWRHCSRRCRYRTLPL